MADWLLPLTRFALYFDLGLAFGWPVFSLYALRGAERRSGRVIPLLGPIVLFGVAGLLLSMLGMTVVVASMSGTSPLEIDPEMLQVVVLGTPMGWAFVVRLSALLLVVAGGVAVRRAPTAGLWLSSGAGAVALATLAWNGHAGATEGWLGVVHLGSDFFHLWAAGLWIAALCALLAMLARGERDVQRLDLAHQALRGFSTLGTVVVGILVATGVINGALILASADLGSVAFTLYGQLLLIKLTLFGAMLALASLNRFRLTPRLEAAFRVGNPRAAAEALRISLAAETTAAISILALVGWLGTLEPTPPPI
jgi:putative copper resistance protein D